MGTVREVFLSAAVAAATVALPTLCQGAETGAPLPAFVENGQAAYRIEVGANATDSELLAVAELSTYLSRVTGLEQRPDKAAYLWQKERLEFARFYDGGAPSPEGIDGRKERIIYVGQTDFARANGLDGAAMAPEEWAVKTVGSNLILTGGRPRGTLYAVYDFLEQACGVWWLDRDTEVVPRNPNLALAPLDRRGKPKAWYRNLGFNGDWRPMGQKMSQFVFEARNRSPVSAFTAEQDMGWKNEAMYNANYRPKWGLETVIWDRNMRLRDAGEPFHTNCHSFYEYLPPAEFYAAHPEYYGLTRENAPKTLPTRGNGKMCLTHPEVRRIVTGRMLDLIRRDRAAERSFGTKPPRFYDLSMDDSLDPIECPCAACRDFVTKHGTESDLLLDFVNTVAAAVEKQYPDVTITTLAYSRYMRPPQTLKPRGNVLVEWCNWIVANFPSGHINTPVPDQALTHPDNAWRLESLRAWRGTGARLAVWEYMEYGYGSGIPATFAPYAIGNYQAYNEMGVEWFYECAIGKRDAVWSFENFAPLRRWMTLRLMADPACDVPRMLDVFFRGYYGPATKPMRAFYELLVANQSKPRALRALSQGRQCYQTISWAAMFRVPRPTLDYLTSEFYLAIQRLLDEAEAAAAADPDALLRVQRERPRVDHSMLDLWGELERQLPDDQKLPFERAKVLERFAAQAKAVTEGFSWRDKAGKAKYIEGAVALLRDARLPEPFAAFPAREWMDVTSKNFNVEHLTQGRPNIIVHDPDSTIGRVMVFGLGAEPDNRDDDPRLVVEMAPGWTQKPLAFHLAGLKHALTPEQFPRDGKYHLYKLGRTNLLDVDTSVKVVMNGKVVGGLNLANVATRRDRAAEWNAHVYAKLAGPSFAQSADKDCVRIERILLVRAVSGFERPEDERKRLAKSVADELAAAPAGSKNPYALSTVYHRLAAAQAARKVCDLPVAWKFRQDPKDEGLAARWFEATPAADWRDIRVGESWTTQEAGKGYQGTAWYSVEFTAPMDANTAPAQFQLLFGAVDGICRVWLDGKPVGEQLEPPTLMWNLPFAFDLAADAVKPGGTHRLVVMVNKQSHAAGIWKLAELRAK